MTLRQLEITPLTADFGAQHDLALCRGVSERLGHIVAANAQIQMIACGHVHRSIQARWSGTLVTTTPSVSFQYPLDLNPHEDLDPILEPPAVRLIVDLPEAGLVSHLSYVESFPAVTGVPVQATVSQQH